MSSSAATFAAEDHISVKLPGWENRLVAFLADCTSASFRPGKLDCGLFFAKAVEVMTGMDIYSDWPSYKTIEEGLANMQEKGFADHVEYAASFFPEWESPLLARRGDGAMVEDMHGAPALGIIQGEQVYVMGLKGIGLVSLLDVKRAFAI